ncbi:hypothetical protein DDZ18_03020 [Marinicauda salina]|uniref:Type II secretion system protein GspF domain-containing protein n=1 Tax=Marinicauda salina TaxID=2135793 RepID=A0A2U2BX75_9PROT|nr:type II secretion system F family protein [Marinicauda salina]PWE18590.1 hypothetical protein DDZ18_03020 [Marinicauda salina]
MSDVFANQVIYAMVFIAILLGVEGMFLLVRSSSRARQAVERRMREESTAPEVQRGASLRRGAETSYGPISDLIVRLFPSIAAFLAQTESRASPALLAAGALLLAIVVTLLLQALVGLPPLPALGVGLLCGLGVPILGVNILVGVEKAKFRSQLPNAIDLVARGLEAGHPVPVALGLVGKEMDSPIGPAFRQAIDEINYGLDRAVALRHVAEKYPDPNLRFFIASIDMQRETGGNLVSVLKNLTRVIRERENMRKKAFALSAEGRMTAFIVGSLPFIVIGAIFMLNPDYYMRVLDRVSFIISMVAAFSLWGAGLFWIWRMVNVKV